MIVHHAYVYRAARRENNTWGNWGLKSIERHIPTIIPLLKEVEAQSQISDITLLFFYEYRRTPRSPIVSLELKRRGYPRGRLRINLAHLPSAQDIRVWYEFRAHRQIRKQRSRR